MNLSWQACNRARRSRDARFDGKFFIGVLTTGIYCRPICASRSAKDGNVRYFPLCPWLTAARSPRPESVPKREGLFAVRFHTGTS